MMLAGKLNYCYYINFKDYINFFLPVKRKTGSER
jgi:hypothetical protein